MTDKKKNDGRADPVLVRLPEDLMRALDAMRRAEEDPPTRPEMIRRILQAWIDQHPVKK
ncbi:ribbon-helix-helix domain-containing protein [Nioella sp.]|uniref:ribbon-helix-helix domain-containing protein n=1 Tax=Nioella sp. TaxID=1912091 RepID=UPI003A8387EE